MGTGGRALLNPHTKGTSPLHASVVSRTYRVTTTISTRRLRGLVFLGRVAPKPLVGWRSGDSRSLMRASGAAISFWRDEIWLGSALGLDSESERGDWSSWFWR